MFGKPNLKLWLLLVFACLTGHVLSQRVMRLNYFGVNASANDTLALNVFYTFRWNIEVQINAQEKIQCLNCRADSLLNDLNAIEQVYMHTSFIADSTLLNELFALRYKFTGSVRLMVNSHTLLAAGSFSNSINKKVEKISHDDFMLVLLSDTLNQISIDYIPAIKQSKWNFSLLLLSQDRMKQKTAESLFALKEEFALGFFYLAFAIIFIALFLFAQSNNENLYFACFAFFASLYFIINATFAFNVRNFYANYAMLLAIEFLAMFFSRILINQERFKWSILLLSLLFISLHFTGYYEKHRILVMVVVSVLIVFSSLSCFYYLIQGFFQKKWEARLITFGSLTGVFLSVLVPTVYVFLTSTAGQLNKESNVIDYISDVGICLYPLIAAIILGKRNASVQQKLVLQVETIRKLAEENLEKEKERKKLVEEQNQILDAKVKERTQELALKNELITLKNRETTESLVYARRIQSAILPDLRLFHQLFEQSFVLYLPKDIVSGDFYFLAHQEQTVTVACADCTGHGVAGAFMSMIGSSLFNQLINEQKIDGPAEVLDKLNEGIIHALKQRESESNDGMDVALCTFSLNEKKVRFAGANRPLWLIRNGELLQFKSNNFPIGGLQVLHDEKFSQQEIALQSGDTLYLFTDGFADQFGGPFGKKLMSKRLREFLLHTIALSMEEQEQALRKLFLDWKGSHEQVDDVLVIGIRI
jgi:serine phosphatase RsbU (regulator of sigma subunit)